MSVFRNVCIRVGLRQCIGSQWGVPLHHRLLLTAEVPTVGNASCSCPCLPVKPWITAQHPQPPTCKSWLLEVCEHGSMFMDGHDYTSSRGLSCMQLLVWGCSLTLCLVPFWPTWSLRHYNCDVAKPQSSWCGNILINQLIKHINGCFTIYFPTFLQSCFSFVE